MADGSEHARLRAIAARVERAFPLTCRRTLLILSDLDPDQLQAQWQVEPGHLALVRGGFPSGLDGVRPRLRLLRVDAGDREVAALSLPDGGGQEGGVVRFLVSGGLGTHYRAELGLASPEGGWLLLTRSEVVSVPPRPREIAAYRVAPEGPVEQADGPPTETPSEVASAPNRPPEVESLCRDFPSNPAEASGAGEAPIASSVLVDPTLADPGVHLAPVFPLPLLPEAPIGYLAPRQTTAALAGVAAALAARGRFRPLPVLGITPLVIAREPPPPGQPPGQPQGQPHDQPFGTAPGEGLVTVTHSGSRREGRPGGAEVRSGGSNSEPHAPSPGGSNPPNPGGSLAHLVPPGSSWPLPPFSSGSPTSPAWLIGAATPTAWDSWVSRLSTPVAPGWSPTDHP